MKTTVKEYQNKVEIRKTLNHEIQNFPDGGLWADLEAKQSQLSQLKDTYFKKLDTVKVSFMCGYRLFYREVIKIGKTLFDSSSKMTKSNGYYAVEIIPVITDKMTQDMISDSYYY